MRVDATQDFYAKYDHIFKSELEDYSACKYGEHRIVTGIVVPAVQRNFQVPKSIEVKN
jgi:hypothetical protein